MFVSVCLMEARKEAAKTMIKLGALRAVANFSKDGHIFALGKVRGERHDEVEALGATTSRSKVAHEVVLEGVSYTVQTAV